MDFLFLLGFPKFARLLSSGEQTLQQPPGGRVEDFHRTKLSKEMLTLITSDRTRRPAAGHSTKLLFLSFPSKSVFKMTILITVGKLLCYRSHALRRVTWLPSLSAWRRKSKRKAESIFVPLQSCFDASISVEPCKMFLLVYWKLRRKQLQSCTLECYG